MDGVPTIAGFGRELLGIYRSSRRPRTVAKLGAVLGELERTLAPPGSGRPALVSDLTTAGVARWQAATGASRGPNTMIGLLGYVRAIVAHAIDGGLLERPPRWRLLRPSRAPAKRARILAAEDVRRLLAHLRRRAPSSWKARRDYALVGLVALAGLRRDEARYLRWEDVRLEEEYIALEGHELRPLKTADSAQAVPICRELASIVRGWRPWVPPDCPWYSPGVDLTGPWVGGRPGHRAIDRLKAAGRAVGIEGLTWQSLRRTWGVHASTRWRLTDREIMRVLRHTEPETSRRHYDGTDLANLRLIAERVGYGH